MKGCKVIAGVVVMSIIDATWAVTTNYTEETGVIQNPGQGWTVPSESIYRKCADYLNIGDFYQRYSWAMLEPKEGAPNWKPLETLIKAAVNHGLPASFRVMCANSGAHTHCTPPWVWEKGAQNLMWEGCSYSGTIITNYCPVFDDQIFIKQHRKFIDLLAGVYDGDPRLAGIDMGSYGNWGEWHCGYLPPQIPQTIPPEYKALILEKKIGYMELKKLMKDNGHYGKAQSISIEDRKQYLDMYLQNFHKTTLVAMTDGAETLNYSIGDAPGSRVGLRRDGVGGPWHQKTWIGSKRYKGVDKMGEVWKYKPIWFEFIRDCNWILKEGGEALLEDTFDFMMRNHVSLVNCFPAAVDQIKDHPVYSKFIERVNLYAGARLVPVKAVVTRQGNELSVELEGVNKGVARIYLDYVLMLVARDGAGKDVWEKELEANPTAWLPGEFRFLERVKIDEKLSSGVQLFLRLRSRAKVLRDFRFAAKEIFTSDGMLPLGAL